ncbi:DYHC2 [Dirofilaria immitis]|nr:DYHC2 [Dirofilaria immitis]
MPFFDEMASDLKNCENNWLLYEQFNAGLQEMANEKWILFRSKTYRFDEYLHKWDDELKNLSITHITARLRKDIDQFKVKMLDIYQKSPNTIVAVRNMDIVSMFAEQPVDKGNNFSLHYTEMSSGLKYCRGEILSSDHWLMLFRILGMPKGTTLEHLRFGDFLNVHKMICENLEALKNLNERAQGEITIREAIQELELWAQQVKDSEALLQSLKIRHIILNSLIKLRFGKRADTEQYLQWMNEIQRKWIYLEPIFGRGSLPSEASRFNRVDVEFRIVLNDVVQDPRIVSLSTRASLKRTLEQIIDQLNRCQKALNQFLEILLLGDDDLLEMLGIHKAVFGSNDETIVAIVSSDGEIVQLSKAVRIVPQAEKWLQELSNEMKNTIRKLIIKCVAETSPDPGKYPSQVLCLSEQIRFCEGCERILNGKGDLQSYRKQLKQTLANYINSEISDQVLKLKLKALIMDVIHNISILDELIDNSPCFISSWVWQKQLRFYLESQEYVVIRHIGARFDYTYEYQGNAPKLVHTPLTDKCYLTLTQAMSMGFGGNLYGPAGTGKTESVKALANLFGRQVLVFNCDEGIDVYSMIRIFIGLVQCGAWGCFDEFNRLDQTVLSAVSMQIQVIQDAIMSRSEKCMLADREVPVDLNSAIFITLNPVSKAYGGRQKLPDNLMQLFRPIVMSAPDNELIAETLLSAEGFCDAKKLSRKLVSIFSLSKEMLSSQQHYDWGLRALKTVLCSCGNLLASRVDKNENQVVVDALTLNTISKLTFEDSKRFSILIDDIFSDIEELLEPLKFVASELKITITDMQVDFLSLFAEIITVVQNVTHKKIFELYDQMRQRMGVILLGPSGSGKSTIWKVLQKALTLINKPVKTYWINPKSMAKQKLLGYMDMRTREWSDGVLTVAAREVVKDSSVLAWIICDGDIDPEWIEALNSVLDDNRLLTMPSGERIQFGSNVNFIFETDNLSSASPATISRMGMVLVSEQDMDIQELINNWLKEHNDVHPAMSDWIRDHLYRCLDWIWTKGVIEIVVSKTAMVQNALSHARDVTSNDEFLVALYRGLAPNLNPKSRNQFAAEVVFNEVKLPVKQNPRNIYYDKRARSLSTYTDEMDISNSNDQLLSMERIPYILTANAQANRDTICSWLDNRNRQPFIIYGPDGSGKESLLRYCLKLDPNSQIALLHCSAQTGSQQVLDLLHQYCIQIGNASGRVLKPKEKQNLILYIKGINIVKPDKWGFCEIIAFLQQLLTYGGYYNEKLEWISLENIQLVLSITLANDEGHYLLPSRFVSLLRICTVEYPTQEELITIYSSYLTFLIKDSMEPLRRRLNDLAIIMVRLFNDVRNTFKPTDKAHYVFTLKDLSNWVFNLTRYDITDNLYVSGRGALSMTTLKGAPLSLIPRKEYAKLLQQAVLTHEFEVANFKMPIFDGFVNLCSQIDRVITASGGSLLLAGRAGMGRREAASLVANIHQMPVLSPRITSSYGIKQFRNDLKTVIQDAAINDKHIVYIIEDYQLLHDTFLQSINSLLSSGDLPVSLREQASQDAFQGDLYSYFVMKVKTNLHIILILNIDDANFAIRCSSNPSLYKECSIIWNETWNKDALSQLSELILSQHHVKAANDILIAFGQIYHSCPPEIAPPAKYIRLIENYVCILNKKRTAIEIRSNRLKAGISKLTEARESVEPLLREAREAVGSIKSESLSEIRSLRAPPEAIRDILQAVLLFMGIFDTSWEAMRKFLARNGVKDEIINFDARRISPDNAKRASAAAAPLAAWVQANLDYSTILERAEKQMEKLSKGLETVDERETIGVAETLIDRLSGEYERWQDQISNLQNELNCLEKGSLLSAAFVTFLGSESEQLNWSNKGLPTDALSQENAMILFNTIEIPLIIDPSGRASSFLEKHLKAKQVEKVNANDSNFLTQVELAVRFGKFLLIDNVDKIEPTLINLLRKDFFQSSGMKHACIEELITTRPRNVVQIGEKTVDYNDSFRLYICSKNNSLRLDQTAKATIALICFSITQTGLASQMLGLAIQIEKPILETRLNELTSNVEQMKIKLDGIEQSLLQALASSEGSLLSNMDLLDSLNKSKENAETIAISLVEADKLQRQLVKEKNIYRPLAEAASSLYFIIHDLHKQNPMYSFNINTVINLYSRTFSKVKESTDATGRMEKLRRILQHSEWELFTGSIVDDDTIHPVEKINWIGSERKAAVAKLQKHLPILFNNLRFTDEGLWREFARTLNCEKTFPPAIDAIMTPFQKLLVIQAIRPERLYPAMISFVVNILGVPSINPSPLDLSSVYKSESSSNEPIMILISPSADPSQQISIAKFYQISMGQGQRQVALEAIRTCSAKGGWVCLKNLHLAIDDIAEIEKEFLTSKRDPSFRLWLTSESNEHFSPQLLQTSLKIVYEAPPGIKNNMKRIYAQWQQSEINFSAVCLQSLFILAWLHALLQERRMFIPQAWSKFYEFNNSDLRVARKFVENVTRDNKIVDWQLIHGLMQTVAYGGRIDNDFDMNVLNVYLKRYFNPSIIGTNGAEIAQNISIPFSSNITDYINVININIPEEDNPSLFGLPSNISTAREMAETINTIRQIRSMQIVGTTEVTFDRNVWNKALNPILTLWKRLNSQSTLHSMNVPSAQHTDDPILEIISLEYVHAITLVQKVHKFLGAVSKCLRGIQMLTPEIAINARTLMMHQTPEEWQEAWIGPSDPAQYLSALGALFEEHIVETKQISPTLTTAPNLYIAWISANAPDVYEKINQYLCHSMQHLNETN